MIELVVISFPDEATAQRGLEALRELEAEDRLVLNGAGIVSRDSRQDLNMQVVVDRGLGVAATGALIGGLSGLSVGMLAGAILAAGGAVWGASAAITSRGAGKKLMTDVSRHLKPGAAALVADIDTRDMAAVNARMEALGGTLRRLSVSE